MLIQGNSMDTPMLISAFSKAKEDDDCVDLDIRDVNFDYDDTEALVDAISNKKIIFHNNNNKKNDDNDNDNKTTTRWKAIKISGCNGLINDVTTACMSANTQLESFHLQSATVNVQTMFALSFGLKYSHSLLHLSLSIDIDASSASLWRSFARNMTLETLKLSGSNIHSSALGHFGFALRINRTLTSLSLDACYLEDSEMASLLMALQDHPKLSKLSLQQNSCHTDGMAAISCLLTYNEALEELDMSYLIRKKKKTPAEEEEEVTPSPPAEVEEEDDKEGETKGGEGEEKTEEEDGDDSIGDGSDNEDAADEDNADDAEEDKAEEAEEEGIIKNKSLRVYQLAGNGLSDGFVESLLGIFGTDNRLEELNLFGNRIGDVGVDTIIQKLPKLTRLKSLWLGHNQFSTDAVQRLVDAMKQNYVLQDVNVRSMTSDASWDVLQDELDYYCRLNRSGRGILSADKDSVPLSLWPFVLERANKIYWGAKTNNTLKYYDSGGGNASHAADSIYCFLRGPALFENPRLQ